MIVVSTEKVEEDELEEEEELDEEDAELEEELDEEDETRELSRLDSEAEE